MREYRFVCRTCGAPAVNYCLRCLLTQHTCSAIIGAHQDAFCGRVVDVCGRDAPYTYRTSTGGIRHYCYQHLQQQRERDRLVPRGFLHPPTP